tara:strand:- start:147 stop:719 length:573 start_codon:yes stop_codon:yes gene_type:complete
MSATNAPFGLRPAFHPSGLDRAQALAGGIASAYSSDILKGQGVKLNSSGNIVIVAAGDSMQGAFAGVEWTDTTGRRRVSNYWPASTSYQTGSCVAYFYNDPQIVYEIQADGSLAQTAIGDQADLSNVAAGSNVTGLSQCTLSSSLVGASSTATFKIVDLAPYADNAWGDAYTVVRVQLNESQFQATVVAI